VTTAEPELWEPLEERVIVLAPFGRDSGVVSQTLRRGGMSALPARDMRELAEHVRAGAGAALVTQEALGAAGSSLLLTLLSEQPAWSDLPVFLLITNDPGQLRHTPDHLLALESGRNVTVIQRPLPGITLITTLQSALRARRRQYEVRDLLGRERLAREQAEAATRIKDEFLATVSHELRTPLGGILIWAQLLEAGRLTAEQAHTAVRSIVTGAEAQSRLIEDLLDVSRMLTGRLRLELLPHRIGPIVQAAVDVVRTIADAKGVELVVELTAASETCLLDADRAQQICWNLLSNAVKFTPSGGSVSLSLTHEPAHVVLRVADTGQGISPEFLPHVFESFRQMDGAQTRRHGGLGLGLSIVRQLAELHGGTVQAHSAGAGKGATFLLRLPVPPLPLDARAAREMP
jgi:signal transduction histidine kinase